MPKEDLFATRGPAGQNGPPCYADVAVRQGRRVVGILTYTVPDMLREQISPGQVVWVPVRQDRLPGVVVDVHSNTPDFNTKAVLELIDAQPVLTVTQIELGRWIADYYLCSLAKALFAMLPPGLLPGIYTVVALTGPGETRSLKGLAPTSQQVITTLRAAGSDRVTVAGLARKLGMKRKLLRRRLTRLARRGWLTQESCIGEPRARPRVVPFLVLTVSADEVANVRDRLLAGRRDLVAARVLESLAGEPNGSQEARTLRDLGARRRTFQLLEEAGLARMGVDEAGRSTVRLVVLPEVAREQAAAMRRTKGDERQAAMLAALEEATGRALPLSALYRVADGADRSDVADLVAVGMGVLEDREVWRDPVADLAVAPTLPPVLTTDQGQVWQELYPALQAGDFQAFLLHGVTGSGKTEIYLRALGATLRAGRQGLVLVPEIALTPQTVQRFAARFPGRVAVLHSGLSVGQRYDQWRRIRDGHADVVIGPRSALFAPLSRLGLIVVDEEHDASYKQDDPAPRYHARETALALGRLTNSVVILGSATPALETYHQAQQGHIRLLELPARIRVRELDGERQVLLDTALPPVLVVNMREELLAGNTSMFSRSLQRALQETLAREEQAILFLNRRGTSTVVLCRECGYVARCPRCEVAYVYHRATERLVCHRCSRTARPPRVCPECGGRKIRYLGAGTERVASEVEELLPGVRVLRWDHDAARNGQGHRAIWDAFRQHQADIVVGTQMVAKGLDLPLVSLVGVVSADTALHLPDLRSAERTFQLVTQVVGRAGRRENPGRAIVQTYQPSHYAILAAAQHNYGAFFRQELRFRRKMGYPPFAQVASLVYSDGDEVRGQQEAQDVACQLQAQLGPTGGRLIGPTPAFVFRRNGHYRWQILVLAPEVHVALRGLDLPEQWAVEVDPASLLS